MSLKAQRRGLKRRLAWTAGLIGAGFTAAVALASENRQEPSPLNLFDRVQQNVVIPVKILSSARIEGIANAIGPVSGDLQDRMAWVQSEIRKLQDLPGMKDRVPAELIEVAYAAGFDDAVQYEYGEAELDQIVTQVGAMGPDLIKIAYDLRGKLVGAGLDAGEAETIALQSVQAGARSVTDQSDAWITELGSTVDSWQYAWSCGSCGEAQISAIISLPFESLLQASEKIDEAWLFSHNDRLDVSRAFSRKTREEPELLAALEPEV